MTDNRVTCPASIMRTLYANIRGSVCATTYHVYQDSYADPDIADYPAATLTSGGLTLDLTVGAQSLGTNAALLKSNKYIHYVKMAYGQYRGLHTACHFLAIDQATGRLLSSPTGSFQVPSVSAYATADRPNPFGLAGGIPWPQCAVEGFAPETFTDVTIGLIGNPYFYSDISGDNQYTGEDPFDPGGGSVPGGGEGTFDDTSVPVDVPSLPSLSASDTGFITLFNPSLTELLSLASYMWSSLFDLTTFKRLFADPMDCILGLSIVPVAVPDGGQSAVKVGNISTGVSMTKAASQYVTVDCGSLQIQEYWGAYLDYAPFTSAEIYLPYIGTHPLALDDIMGKTLHVTYHVDILSGACCAYIQCDGTVLYSFIGQCSSSIPVSGKDFTNVVNGVLSVAAAIGTMVATGGTSAPAAIKTVASNATNVIKPQVEKSGAMSGTGGLLGVQVPYIILTRPRQALPAGQNALMGYPAFITRTLGTLAGYTEVESIHLEGIPCTSEELTEIETLLGQGVIL